MKHLILALALVIALAANAVAQGPQSPVVKFETSLGDITIALFPDKAPVTVKNFLDYVKAGHYDGTTFHRVIPGFMIQGGGYDADLKEKTPAARPIKNEADNGLKNDSYFVAMARTADPDSARAQFFINTANNYTLNHTGKSPQGWGYAVFGKVIAGRETVDKIKAVQTTRKGMHENVPVTPVIIKKAIIVQQ